MSKYTTLNRRGYKVIVPTDVYNELYNEGYNIGLVLGKSKISSEPYKSVQLFKNAQYCGTLKSAMGVSGFKNGNPCDFRAKNLIEAE